MQIQAENYNLFANLVDQAKNIIVLADKNQTADLLYAALFFESHLATFGKNVQIVAGAKLPEDFRQFETKVKYKIEPKKLVVSLNWRKNAVDKVSYNLDGEYFNFVVTPRNANIKPEDIKVFQKGSDVDLIVALGVDSLSSLTATERDYIRDKDVVNIDIKSQNQLFGRLNIVNEAADSVCGVIADLIEKTGMQSPPSSIDFLLRGIREATENFSRVNDPTTFEAAAFCTKVKKGQTLGRKFEIRQEKFDAPAEWLTPKVFRSKNPTS
ncbi:MAG: hypothetical protein WD187_04165 [Candidatus Woykebacteria bacterium]